jgi:hypothetical protein
MPTTANKGYSVPTTGTESGTWGTDLNTNTFAVIDTNLGGVTSIALSNAPVTLSAAQAQNLILRLTGTLTGAVAVTTPCLGLTLVENATTGAFAVTIANGFGTPVTVTQGHRTSVITDATNGPRIVGSSQLDDLATVGAIRRLSTGLLGTDSGATSISFSRDYAGNVVATGIQGDLEIPFACTITAATLLANISGSLVVDIWRTPFASFPPVVGNSICGGVYPTLSAAASSKNTTLIGWTTGVNAGDILRYNVNSAATISRFTLSLTVTRY